VTAMGMTVGMLIARLIRDLESCEASDAYPDMLFARRQGAGGRFRHPRGVFDRADDL